MKLGIAVVYMVLPDEEELVDLHLRQIERHTRVPFTLYAATNRLPTNLRDRLAAKPYVRVCSIPTTDLRGGLEHAYYLERLIAKAIEDNATHVVTLHVDSFPIRSAWATDLAAKLSYNYAFAAIVRDELRTNPEPDMGSWYSRRTCSGFRCGGPTSEKTTTTSGASTKISSFTSDRQRLNPVVFLVRGNTCGCDSSGRKCRFCCPEGQGSSSRL